MRMGVNVYDFDNTIYDGESLVDLILYYIPRDPRIWRYLPQLIRIAFRDRFRLFTVEEAVRAYAGFLEGYYVKLSSLEEDVVRFWNRHEHKIKPFYEKQRRADDIIVSGSTDFLLAEIMKRMGITRYIGSSIDPRTGKFTRLCFLENKVKLFQEQYPNVQIANFYTDSMNDRAMMDISIHVFLVKKNQVTQIK